MGIRETIRISSKSIFGHLKRSLMVIVTMNVAFGLVLAMNLWLKGVENAYVKFASEKTGGRVVMEVTNYLNIMAVDDEMPEMATRQEMVEDVEAHGGKVLGETERVGRAGMVVLPEELIKEAIVVDLGKVPEDAIPVLVSDYWGERWLETDFPPSFTTAEAKLAAYEKMRSDLIGRIFTDERGGKYCVVGLTSGGFQTYSLSFEQVERENKNTLNVVLGIITTPSGPVIAVDNGKSEKWQGGEKTDIPIEIESLMVAFENIDEAYDYLRHGKGQFMNVELPNRIYTVNVIAGMSPEVQHVFWLIQLGANVATVILVLAAAVIVIFTSVRLMEQERQNIALYHHLGATTGQIRGIYGCYFLGLMICAAVLAFALASIAVLLFSILNQELMGVQAMTAFNLDTMPMVVWYGMNINVLIAMLVMLAMAGVCVLVNRKRFKA